jgi:hypothetical protein
MKQRLALACSFTAACASLVWRSPSRAASAGDFLDLEWVAPAECPGRGEVLVELERLVGVLPAAPSHGGVRARVVLSRGADANSPWRGVVTTFGEGAGERSLRAPSCRALVDATALILALRVDPTLEARMAPSTSSIAEPRSTAGLAPSSASAGTPPLPASTPTPLPAPTPPPPPPTPAPLPSSPPPAAPPRPQHSQPATTPSPKPALSPPHEAPRPMPQEFALGASILGELGAMPSLELDAEVSAAWLLGRWRIELRAATGLVQNVDVPGESGVGASLRAFSGGARGCYRIVPSSVVVTACALSELDWVWASGYAGASATVQDKNAGWMALGGGVLFAWRLNDRVSVRANVDSAVPLTRPRFVTKKSDETVSGLVLQPSALIGRMGAGVEFHF